MKLSLSLLALVSVTAAVAIETHSKTRAASFVSFEQWVEGIIANPDGDHISPDEALAAHEAMINSTDVEDLEARALQKRVYCYDDVQQWAPASDAAACIDYLASIGSRDCTVHSGSQQLFRRIRGARIWGTVSGDNYPATDSCQNVARTGGRIMDGCTRNGRVRGFGLVNNGRFGVGITGT